MPSSDITYKVENSSIGKTFVVRVNHLKKLVGKEYPIISTFLITMNR